jgi:hypothetical protein
MSAVSSRQSLAFCLAPLLCPDVVCALMVRSHSPAADKVCLQCHCCVPRHVACVCVLFVFCVCLPSAGVIFAASGKGFWSAKPVDNEVSSDG